MYLKHQKQILEAAMTAGRPFRPKYIVEKPGLGYNIASPQLERLVDKKILVKDKEPETFTVSDEARQQWTMPLPEKKKEITSPDSKTEAGNEKPLPTPPTEESLGLSPRNTLKLWA